FARELLARVGVDRTLILLQDSYYFDRSKDFKGDGSLNFDHPDSIDWDLMAEHIQLLKQGETIDLPIYDFATHSRLKEVELVKAKPIIIVDGILIFYPDQIRDLLDLSIYIDTPDHVCFERRLYRDTHERGRTAEGVRVQYTTTVRPMREQFVEPSKALADQVVSGQVDFKAEIERVYKEISNFNSEELV
ncbi:MAG: uridine kinase, partial [Bdellovibrionota bacterium]